MRPCHQTEVICEECAGHEECLTLLMIMRLRSRGGHEEPESTDLLTRGPGVESSLSASLITSWRSLSFTDLLSSHLNRECLESCHDEDDDIPDARMLLWMTLRHVCRTPLTVNTRGSLRRSWASISLYIFSDKRESLYLFPI